jgi:PA14 domain
MCRKLTCLISFVSMLIVAGSAAGQSGTGLRAEYYLWSGSSPPAREDAFRDLFVTRIDPQIYCYWNPGFQAVHPDGLKPDFKIPPPPGLRSDYFAIRWSGEIEALKTEAYTFITGSDDGVRVWLNGELIIDDWTDHDRTEDTSDPVNLVAGRKYPLVVEGYENAGEAEWEFYWQSPSTAREPVPQEVLYPAVKSQDFPASNPVPADEAVLKDTWATLEWTAGPRAASHDVYFGDSQADVDAGTGDTFRGNQPTKNFVVGFPGFPYPDGLVPGTTYYWRIDEVNTAEPNSPWKGPVWSFTVAPLTAFGPNPADGADAAALDAKLTWKPGFGAKLHFVYFGEDFDTVSNAAGGPPTGLTTYDPGALDAAKVYYWRVDEFDGAATHKGDVWSFTTLGAVARPRPSFGEANVKQTRMLRWTAGDHAASHQVYFGTNEAAVRNAGTNSPQYKGDKQLGDEKYDPGLLDWDTTYYWRVDEVNSLNPDSPWKGNVWHFTTANFFVVDDFEDYTDNDAANEAIWQSWIDGFDVPENGSQVGNTLPPYAEITIVHGGFQSMPYSYDVDQKYAEATMTLTYPRNWTDKGVTTLTIWFRGDWINVAAPMYVVVNGSAVVNSDPSATRRDVWTQWNIPLQTFADEGVDLTNVNTIALGFGDKANPQAGGSGVVYFDDIQLH